MEWPAKVRSAKRRFVGSAVAWSVGMVAGVVVDGVPELWVEILDFAGVVGSSEFEK
ncbi:MAG TPA: hypothetical protein VMU92_11380 [Acidobacteriaceae bacterium]|nr:hypothetical protein [Acidobacteriaceae bacterium]